MDTIRKHYLFSGSVQGVGFRWNAKFAAEKFGITGWVQNLDDGTVEMEAEGTPHDLACLIHALRNARWVQIDEITERQIPVQGGYGFDILD